MTAQAMCHDVLFTLSGIAEQDVLDLVGSPIGDVLDLLMQELGHILALLIAQGCKGRHALFGPAVLQEFRNLCPMLIFQYQLRVNEARSLRTARQWSVT